MKMDLFTVGLIVIVVVVLTWGRSERKRDERDAQRDINELTNKGYSYEEAVWHITNARDI